MNQNCLEYNYTQTVKGGEGWIIYLISFPLFGIGKTCGSLGAKTGLQRWAGAKTKCSGDTRYVGGRRGLSIML